MPFSQCGREQREGGHVLKRRDCEVGLNDG